MMADNSQQPTEIMTSTRQATVLRCMAGVGGGIGSAPVPILMVCTTTHPGPQMTLELCGGIGMVVNIP